MVDLRAPVKRAARSYRTVAPRAASSEKPAWFKLDRSPMKLQFCYSGRHQEAAAVDITSPFFVVPLIVVVSAVSILFSTSTKEDHSSTH
jgi:hypothetical protein